ncbi:hypothetical protein ACFL35_11885 [Candidatus Riflebacteria bacterium]
MKNNSFGLFIRRAIIPAFFLYIFCFATFLSASPTADGLLKLSGRVLSHIGASAQGAYLGISFFDKKKKLILVLVIRAEEKGKVFFKADLEALNSTSVRRIEIAVLNPNSVLDKEIREGLHNQALLHKHKWEQGIPGNDLIDIEKIENSQLFTLHQGRLLLVGEKKEDFLNPLLKNLKFGNITVIFGRARSKAEQDYIDAFNRLQEGK